MDIKYVAFVDVLGFGRLLLSEDLQGTLRRYRECLDWALEPYDIEYLVFSDSIALIAEGAEDSHLEAITLACSNLMYGMLALPRPMPIRGCISVGRCFFEKGIVAGSPIVDAYQYENRQNWAGIMFSPRVLEKVNDLSMRFGLSVHGLPEGDASVDHPLILGAERRLADLPLRAAAIHAEVPFHGSDVPYEGIAIVPTCPGDYVDTLADSVREAMDAISQLREEAPDPAAQAKYNPTTDLLGTALQSVMYQTNPVPEVISKAITEYRTTRQRESPPWRGRQ